MGSRLGAVCAWLLGVTVRDTHSFLLGFVLSLLSLAVSPHLGQILWQLRHVLRAGKGIKRISEVLEEHPQVLLQTGEADLQGCHIMLGGRHGYELALQYILHNGPSVHVHRRGYSIAMQHADSGWTEHGLVGQPSNSKVNNSCDSFARLLPQPGVTWNK